MRGRGIFKALFLVSCLMKWRSWAFWGCRSQKNMVDYLSEAIVFEEIGYGDSSVRTTQSVQISLVELTILNWGTEAQKQYFLPKLCSGEWIGCFGLTEPERSTP